MKRSALLALMVMAGACDRTHDPVSSYQRSDPPPDRSADVTPVPTPPVEPLPKPLFWAITKDGQKGTTTYALGTIHGGVDAQTKLPKIVWDKLADEPAFAMETNLNDPVLATMGRRSSGTLHAELGDEYWRKLEQQLSPSVAAQLDKMKPMIPATLLSMKGLPPAPSMDRTLMRRAADQGKRMVYLEPASDELAMLEHIMDLRMLKLLLDDPDLEKSTHDMLAAYLSGDDTKLVAVNDSQKPDAIKHGYTAAEYDALMDEMLYHRNSAWIPAIEKLHADGGGFIAVGALHLVGPRSVLALLEAKGYRIVRVVSSQADVRQK